MGYGPGDKTISPVAWQEHIDKEAKDIFQNFKKFTHGVNTLFLIQRHGDGGETNNSHLRKVIVNGPDEYLEELKALVKEKMEATVPLRIYASVNPRNVHKAIQMFKHRQVDAEDWTEEDYMVFYMDIKNRFFSCLMSPSCSGSSNFLFDCDSSEAWDECTIQLGQISPDDDLIIAQYPTKNGWHVVTRPFNPNLFKEIANCELKKDALLLLSY